MFFQVDFYSELAMLMQAKYRLGCQNFVTICESEVKYEYDVKVSDVLG